MPCLKESRLWISQGRGWDWLRPPLENEVECWQVTSAGRDKAPSSDPLAVSLRDDVKSSLWWRAEAPSIWSSLVHRAKRCWPLTLSLEWWERYPVDKVVLLSAGRMTPSSYHMCMIVEL